MGYANPGLKKVVIDPAPASRPCPALCRSAGVVVAVGSGARRRVKRWERPAPWSSFCPAPRSEVDLRMLGKYLFREKIVRLLVARRGSPRPAALEQACWTKCIFLRPYSGGRPRRRLFPGRHRHGDDRQTPYP